MCFVSLLIGGCKKYTSPEEKMKSFVETFRMNVNNNQLDSLKIYYPEIEKADSLLTISLIDNAEILENLSSPGSYTIKFNPNIILNTTIDKEGNIHVTDSKGLFAYSPDKMEFAKKTGIYADSLTDVKLAQRMNDEGFISYLDNNAKGLKNKILKIGDYSDLERPIINLTDQPISASDYDVIMESYERVDIETGEYREWKETVKGKSIPPHGRVYYEAGGGSGGGIDIEDVVIKISLEDLRNRFMKFTGNEYNEYLESKK